MQDVLFAILRQIIIRRRHIEPDIEQHLNRCLGSSTPPEEMVALAKEKISAFQSVFLIVDALDEYQGNRDDLITKLQEIKNRDGGSLHLMITSRPVPLHCTCSERWVYANPDDVRAYLRARMKREKRFGIICKDLDSGQRDSVQHDIVKEIVSKMGGM
jgi:hypothetical protein